MSLYDMHPKDQLVMIYRKHALNPRPLSEQWLRMILRREGAILCCESATMLPQSDLGYRQFECQHVSDPYPDPPVVTLHENGTWERV